jgi:transposase
MLGVDLTQIHGLGPYVALKLVAECRNDMSRWPEVKHFTSWLCLAPGNKISGGKILSSKTRRSSSKAAATLRLATTTAVDHAPIRQTKNERVPLDPGTSMAAHGFPPAR